MHRFKLLAEAARVSRQEKKCGLSPTLDELVELNEKASMKELMNYGGVGVPCNSIENLVNYL